MANDIQKTRKVLEYILGKFYVGADGYPHARLNIRDKGMIKAALSKPLRNCDVGTADEQAQRYDEFCEKTNCAKCPVQALWGHYFGVVKNEKVSCGLIWAQMLYDPDDPAVDQLRWHREGGAFDGE